MDQTRNWEPVTGWELAWATGLESVQASLRGGRWTRRRHRNVRHRMQLDAALRSSCLTVREVVEPNPS